MHGQLPDDTLEVGGDADVFGVDVVGEGEARRDGWVRECRALTRTSVRRQAVTRHFQSSTDETRSPADARDASSAAAADCVAKRRQRIRGGTVTSRVFVRPASNRHLCARPSHCWPMWLINTSTVRL